MRCKEKFAAINKLVAKTNDRLDAMLARVSLSENELGSRIWWIFQRGGEISRCKEPEGWSENWVNAGWPGRIGEQSERWNCWGAQRKHIALCGKKWEGMLGWFGWSIIWSDLSGKGVSYLEVLLAVYSLESWIVKRCLNRINKTSNKKCWEITGSWFRLIHSTIVNQCTYFKLFLTISQRGDSAIVY